LGVSHFLNLAISFLNYFYIFKKAFGFNKMKEMDRVDVFINFFPDDIRNLFSLYETVRNYFHAHIFFLRLQASLFHSFSSAVRHMKKKKEIETI
jgi:hypothetical protein